MMQLCLWCVLIKKFLLAQKPRLVTPAMYQTWVVFTNASFLGLEGCWYLPMGDRSTSSFELDGDQLKHLNPSGKKTGFQCEFFAVLVALGLWSETVQLTGGLLY